MRLKELVNKKIKRIVLILIIIVLLIYGFNVDLETTHYTFNCDNLPVEFDGYKIAFISDLHCEEFGNREEELIKAIKSCNPAIIVFTGDMIDGKHEDIIPVIDLLAGLDGQYPIYAISGNHEFDDINNYNLLRRYYDQYGIDYLDESYAVIRRQNASIGIYGKRYVGNNLTMDFLVGPDKEEAEFNILLYHDATAFPAISELGFDLVLSGHTHGGIIRLPFIGGLVSNNHSLIAEYENGIYDIGSSTLISSRGLGDAMIPRFLNQPELICITLKK